jgi:PAS domain S-box-containing protein
VAVGSSLREKTIPHVLEFSDLWPDASKGDALLLSVPTHEARFRILPSLLKTIPEKTRVRVFSADPRAGNPDDKRLLWNDLGNVRTAGQFLGKIKTAVRTGKRNELFVIDASGTWIGTPRAFHKLVASTTALLARSRRSNAWIFSEEDVQHSTMLSLPVERLRSARIWAPDASRPPLLQILRDPEGGDPGHFLPRILDLQTGSLSLPDFYSSPVRGEEATAATGPGETLADPFAQLFAMANVGMVVFDLAGTHRRANHRACEILGYDEKQIRSVPIRDLVQKAERWSAYRTLLSLKKKRRASLTVRLHRKNGRPVVVALEAFAISGSLYACVFREVTETTRQLEDLRSAEEEFRTLFYQSPFPQALVVERRIVRWNEAFSPLLHERDRNERSIALSRVLGRQHDAVIQSLADISSQKVQAPSYSAAVNIRFGNGETGTYLLQARQVPYNKGYAALCTFVDVTTREAERRALTESEKALATIIQEMPRPVAMVSGTVFTSANNAFRTLFGLDPALDPVGLSFLDTVGRRDKPRIQSMLEDASPKTRGATVVEYKGQKADGSGIDIRADVLPALMRGQHVRLVLPLDITASNEAHDRTKRETAARNILQTTLDEAAAGLSVEDVVRLSMQSLMKGLHCEIGAAYLVDESGKRLVLKLHEGWSERMLSQLATQALDEGLTGYVAKTLEPLPLSLASYPAHLPYRSLFESEQMRSACYLPLAAGPALAGMIMVASRRSTPFSDEMVQALAMLVPRLGGAVQKAMSLSNVIAAEAMFRSAVESAADVFYESSPTGAFTYVSPVVLRLTGYNPADFRRQPELWRTLIHPDDRASYSARISGQYEIGDAKVLEYRLLPKGKAVCRWVRDTIVYERDQQGTVVTMKGTVSDITSTRALEESLLKAEELKSNIIESVLEGVAVFDTGLKCTDWNRSMEAITGISRSEVLDRLADETIFRGGAQSMLAMLRQAAGGESVSEEEMSLHRSTAEQGLFWFRSFPLRDKEGRIRGVVAIATDVTTRRTLERNVRESEETLRKVIDGMGDALMICDLQGSVWEVNSEFTRITGYTRSDVLGMNFPYPWLIEEEMARFVTWISVLRDRSSLRDFDMTWKSQDGHRVAISLNSSLLRDASGEPVAMLNIARDISDRKRLTMELEQRNRELVALNAISASITGSINMQEVLAVAGNQIAAILGAQTVLFYMRDERKHMLKLAAHRGVPDQSAETIRSIPLEESATGNAIEGGTALLIPKRVSSDERITTQGRKMFHELGLESLAVVPLRSKDEVVGALDIAFPEEHDFGDKEQQFLALIGAQLGSAIENARLYEEIRKQVRRLTSLYEVGRGLAGALDFNTILTTVYEVLRTAIPMDRFLFYSLVHSPSQFTARNDYSIGTDAVGEPFPAGYAITSGCALFDAITAGRALLMQTEEGGSAHASILCAPVLSKQRSPGLLVAMSPTPDAYEEAHLRLLESIANLTGIALDKASLYEDIVRKSKEIESRNKELDDFTYVVSHDLKEPLISIEGYSKILLKEYQVQLGEEGRDFLETVVHSSTRLKSLIDDLLALSRIGRSGESFQNVSLKLIVEEVLRELQFTLEERRVKVHLGELPTVPCDATQIGIVFRNLITNAVKFNDKNDPFVTIASQLTDHEVIVSVRDNGIGIDGRYFEKIFMIFQRLHRNEEYRGTGAGLTIVKKIVENHGGRIWLESEVGKGSTFFFTIPVG